MVIVLLLLLAVVGTIITSDASGTALVLRLAQIGVVLSGMTLALTCIAALVALRAYAQSTGLPALKLQVWFEFSQPNKPVFRATRDENGWLKAVRFKQTNGTISIRNDSNYSAKNPAVVVRLRGMSFIGSLPEWTELIFITTVGITAVQWDGGANYSIHGRSTRKLPVLRMDKLYQIPGYGAPSLAVELLAEGYRREITIPVDFTVDDSPQFPEHNKEDMPPWL